MAHFLRRCIDCDKVIAQCRCPMEMEMKPLFLDVCPDCKAKRKEIEECGKEP
jgi:hypothetical protein